MAVTDWRAWVNQNGGTQPGQTSPYPFPGIQPITDLISGTTSVPHYPNTPITVNAVDPFGGWNAQQERSPTFTMRPQIPGLTSP